MTRARGEELELVPLHGARLEDEETRPQAGSRRHLEDLAAHYRLPADPDERELVLLYAAHCYRAGFHEASEKLAPTKPTRRPEFRASGWRRWIERRATSTTERILWVLLELLATTATIASLGLVSVDLRGQALAAMASSVLWAAIGLRTRSFGLVGLNVLLLVIATANLARAV